VAQHQDLLGPQAERGVDLPRAVAELDLEGVAVGQDVDDGADLAALELLLGEVDRQGHDGVRGDDLEHDSLLLGA